MGALKVVLIVVGFLIAIPLLIQLSTKEYLSTHSHQGMPKGLKPLI